MENREKEQTKHLHITLGEVRRVSGYVTSEPEQVFSITDPTYELSVNGVVEAAGVPELDGHEMFVMVSPKRVGTYRLEMKFFVNGEKLIRRTHIVVER